MAQHEQDRQLVERLIRGEQTAFDGFFHGYFSRLYRFVLPRVGNNDDVAQELCQQTLVRAVRKLAGYRGEASLFTWLCQIARNQISDYWQLQQLETSRVVRIEDSSVVRATVESMAAPLAEQPERLHAQGELLRLVQVALDHLPVHYGNALEWKYLDGLSVTQIAARLGQSAIATQSILSRARTSFREVFASLAGSNGNNLNNVLYEPAPHAEGLTSDGQTTSDDSGEVQDKLT